MALGQNIKHLMARSPKTSFTTLAAHCDTDPQAIQVLVRRDSKTSQFAPDLAEYFSVPLALLLQGEPEDLDAYINSLSIKHERSDHATHPLSAKESTNKGYRPGVPVIGILITGLGELYKMELSKANEGVIAWSTADAEAYSLRIFGDTLAPRARHGEYLIVEPAREVGPGDEVVARKASEAEVLIAVFMYDRDGMHYFEDLNGKGIKLSYPSNEIKSMHYISGFAKSALWRE